MAINFTCLISGVIIFYSIPALAREPGCCKWLALSKIFCFYVGFLFVAIFPFGIGNRNMTKRALHSARNVLEKITSVSLRGFFLLLLFSYPLGLC